MVSRVPPGAKSFLYKAVTILFAGTGYRAEWSGEVKLIISAVDRYLSTYSSLYASFLDGLGHALSAATCMVDILAPKS
jgi:hypothetical protein